MSFLRCIRRHRVLALHLVLGLALLRALVPAGYMPQNGSPWQLTLCTTGLPQALTGEPAGHQPGTHGADCPFGHWPSGGPLTSDVSLTAPLAVALGPPAPRAFSPAGLRCAQSQRARAPPALA